MSDLDWCRQRVAPRGSDLAMSLAFLPDELADPALVFAALREDLQRIPLKVSDPDVARSKIVWWQQACERFLGGQAEHPLLKALMPWRERLLPRRQDLQQWIAALFTQVEPDPLNRWEDVGAGLKQSGLGALRCESAIYLHDADDQVLAQVAVLSGLTRALCGVRRDTPGLAAWLPYAELAEFGLTRKDLADPNPGSDLRAFFDRQAERGLEAAEQVMPASAGMGSLAAPIILRCALDRQLLIHLRRRGPAVLSRAPSVAAHRKLWCLWRQARILRRHSLAAAG